MKRNTVHFLNKKNPRVEFQSTWAAPELSVADWTELCLQIEVYWSGCCSNGGWLVQASAGKLHWHLDKLLNCTASQFWQPWGSICDPCQPLRWGKHKCWQRREGEKNERPILNRIQLRPSPQDRLRPSDAEALLSFLTASILVSHWNVGVWLSDLLRRKVPYIRMSGAKSPQFFATSTAWIFSWTHCSKAVYSAPVEAINAGVFHLCRPSMELDQDLWNSLAI